MTFKKNNNYTLFLTVVTLTFLITLLVKYGLGIDKLVYNFYAEQLAKDQLEKMLAVQQKWAWVGYAIIPLVVLIRSSLVALCLSIGVFFYDIERKIAFKKYMRIALKGEFVLVLVGLFKFGYFYFIKTDFTLQDLQQYYPLSYINFLDRTNLQPWLIYPLQTLNLFELAYILVLVFGLHKLLKNTFTKSLEMVTVSYGAGLLIFMGLVMFLTLNMT
jgi:hypothetical protein